MSVLPAGDAVVFELSLCTAGSPASVCPSRPHESLGQQHQSLCSRPSELKMLNKQPRKYN